MNFNMSFGEKPSSHGRNYYLCLHALIFLCFLDICIILILLLEIINTFHFLLHSTLGMPLFEKKKNPQNTHILGVILIRPSVHFWNLLHVPFLYFPFSLMDYFFKWKRSREKLPTILGTLWRPPFVFWGDKRKHGTWNKEQKVSLTCSRKVKVELWSRHRVRESLGRERTLGFPLERHQSVL